MRNSILWVLLSCGLVPAFGCFGGAGGAPDARTQPSFGSADGGDGGYTWQAAPLYIGTARGVFRVADGAPAVPFGPGSPPRAIAVSPDGARVAFDLGDGTDLYAVSGDPLIHDDASGLLGWADDERLIFLGGGMHARLTNFRYDGTDERVLLDLGTGQSARGGAVLAALSTDGKQVAVLRADLEVISTATGQLTATYPTPPDGSGGLLWTQTGHLLFFGAGGRMTALDVATGAQIPLALPLPHCAVLPWDGLSVVTVEPRNDGSNDGGGEGDDSACDGRVHRVAEDGRMVEALDALTLGPSPGAGPPRTARSPDGLKVAITSGSQLLVAAPDGSGSEVWTSDLDQPSTLAW